MYPDIRSIAIPTLVFDLVLYGCLPLWLIMGYADYCCHRRAGIQHSTGLKESLLHALMGVQIGIPIFLGLFFKINVGILLIMFAALVFHEWIAHKDVAYARQFRQIDMLEVHVHSFLETLPFFTVALIICINWNAFVDLISLNWGSEHLGLYYKPHAGVTTYYVAGYVGLMLIADILPYLEEILRCYQNCKPDWPTPPSALLPKGE